MDEFSKAGHEGHAVSILSHLFPALEIAIPPGAPDAKFLIDLNKDFYKKELEQADIKEPDYAGHDRDYNESQNQLFLRNLARRMCPNLIHFKYVLLTHD